MANGDHRFGEAVNGIVQAILAGKELGRCVRIFVAGQGAIKFADITARAERTFTSAAENNQADVVSVGPLIQYGLGFVDHRRGQGVQSGR